MAMTLRLSDEEADDLRRQAASEHRSMHEVARDAVRLYVATRAPQTTFADELAYVLDAHAQALDELGRM